MRKHVNNPKPRDVPIMKPYSQFKGLQGPEPKIPFVQGSPRIWFFS